MHRTIILAMSGILFLTGCFKKVTLPDVKEAMLQDFHNMGEDISITDLIGMNGETNRQRAEKYVYDLQCKFMNPNPMVSFVGDVTISVKAKIEMKAEAGATPVISIGVATDREQEITLPLHVMSLNTLPEKYLELKIKRMQSLAEFVKETDTRDLFKLEDNEKTKLKTEYREVLNRFFALKDKVASLQNNDLRKCPVTKTANKH